MTAPIFHHWVTNLTNPDQGHGCQHGLWWEDICWHGRLAVAARNITEHLVKDGMLDRRLHLWRDEEGHYQFAERHTTELPFSNIDRPLVTYDPEAP